MEYKLLTNTPASSTLISSPSGYWLLVQFEIVLRSGDDCALLVTHHSYIQRKTSQYESGIICSPFMAFAVNSGELYLDTVGDINDLFNAFLRTIDLDKQIKLFLYVLGLTNYKVHFVGDVLEFKESNREPGKQKCYKLLRYAVTTDNFLGKINLVDPLVLSKNFFLPLDKEELHPAVRRISLDSQGISCSYRGLNLSSNLCRILEDKNEVAKLCTRAIEIPPNLLFKEFRGLIIKVDLANFGKLSKSVLEGTVPFFLDRQALRSQYEISIHRLLLKMIIDYALPHYTLLGDGFLGAFPEPIDEETFINTAGLGKSLQQFVDAVNERSEGSALSYRFAMLLGSYKYGRFNFFETRPYISGNELTRVTRLEEGLKEINSTETREFRVAIEKKTYLQFSSEFGGIFTFKADTVVAVSKESEIEAFVGNLK